MTAHYYFLIFSTHAKVSSCGTSWEQRHTSCASGQCGSSHSLPWIGSSRSPSASLTRHSRREIEVKLYTLFEVHVWHLDQSVSLMIMMAPATSLTQTETPGAGQWEQHTPRHQPQTHHRPGDRGEGAGYWPFGLHCAGSGSEESGDSILVSRSISAAVLSIIHPWWSGGRMSSAVTGL